MNLFRLLSILTKTAYQIRHVRPPAHLSACKSSASTRQIFMQFDTETFMEICQENPYLVKIGQKYQILYMKIYICVIVLTGTQKQFDLYHPMAQPDMHPISFTYAPVASMWGVTLHNLFLYSDPPLPCHTPSYWLRLFSSPTFSLINTPFSNLVILHTYPPMKMEQIVSPETSAYKIQMPENYPEESIRHRSLV